MILKVEANMILAYGEFLQIKFSQAYDRLQEFVRSCFTTQITVELKSRVIKFQCSCYLPLWFYVSEAYYNSII